LAPAENLLAGAGHTAAATEIENKAPGWISPSSVNEGGRQQPRLIRASRGGIRRNAGMPIMTRDTEEQHVNIVFRQLGVAYV
jgi:hypothetical protein